uniref:spermine/spermidine synthase domain-containing protein n=1 Tax=Candidatus Electrothrix sp. TaxID=2170559 RepID=UPI0040576613
MAQKILYLFFFLSGIAGLGYEILWTRMLAVSLGHETMSTLAVLTAFFGGLALGAWFLDRPVSRSSRPRLWYAGLELLIGLWALALLLLIPQLNPVAASLIGVEPTAIRHWTISFCYPFILLLPATFALGGTLPAMERLFTQLNRKQRAVGGLYSVNTLGAMLGTFATTFFIMPLVGLHITGILLATLNIFAALGVFLFIPTPQEKGQSTGKDLSSFSDNNEISRGRIYCILFATGLLGIGFEVLMVRVLSQLFANTVFSFAAILTVYLFGTAAGAACYQRSLRYPKSRHTLTSLLRATGLCCLITVFLLQYAEVLFTALQGMIGTGFWAAVFVEMVTALFFLFLPTVAMGALFSHLAQSLRRSDGGVGHALCCNTLGSAAAPLLFGVILLPAWGMKVTLLVAATGYLLLLPQFRRADFLPTALPASIALGLALLPASYRFIHLTDGETVQEYRQGIMASVAVVQDTNKALHLKVNNHLQMGGTTSVFSDRRQALLPLLLHPAPETALFLGLGTGATIAGVAGYPGLQADGVELLPEVIDLIPWFSKATGDLSKAKNLHFIAADARRFVTATEKQYDLVVADLFHPSRDGAGSLYTVEHFTAIRHLLSEDGIFCQWLPLYQLDLEMFKVISKTFLQAFPEGQAFLGHYSLDYPIIALVGAKKPLRFPENWYRKRLSSKGMRHMATSFGYDSGYSLLGTFLAGHAELRKYTAASPINTDAHPVVLFQAPRFAYSNPASPHTRLLALIAAFEQPDPETVLAEAITEEDMFARERLPAYWRARNSFLRVGVDVQRPRNVRQLYEQVSDPLLKVVRKSIDFSAAYYPLLSIAYDLYPEDQEASRHLLSKLERANPTRREAFVLRQRLFSQEN